jgi:hypothetical protein
MEKPIKGTAFNQRLVLPLRKVDATQPNRSHRLFTRLNKTDIKRHLFVTEHLSS